MRRRFSGLLVAALALAMVVGFSTKADAAFIAYICDEAFCTGGGDVIVTDNGVGDLSATAGGIVTAGAVGGFAFTVNVAQSKPLIGSSGSPSMDLNFTATGVGDAFFYASDTGFTYNGTVSGQVDGNFSGTSQVSAALFGGTSNLNLDLTNNSTILSFLSSPFSGSTSFLVGNTVNPYSLTLGIHIIRATSGTTTGDFLLVPEPAAMALFGLGLLGAGLARRRRTR